MIFICHPGQVFGYAGRFHLWGISFPQAVCGGAIPAYTPYSPREQPRRYIGGEYDERSLGATVRFELIDVW